MSTYDKLNAFIDKKRPNPVEIVKGRVASVTPTQVMVAINGSSMPIPANNGGVALSPNDECFLIRSKGDVKWTVITGISSGTGGQVGNVTIINKGGGGGGSADTAVQAPTDVQVGTPLPGAAMLVWDAKPSGGQWYRVQVSPTGTEADAYVLLTTRGSYAIVKTEVPVSMRVRAVLAGSTNSSWSSWYECSPAPEIPDGMVPIHEFLTYCGEVITANDEVVSYG